MNRVGTIARERAEKVISVSALYKNTRASRAVQTIMNRDHCDCRIVAIRANRYHRHRDLYHVHGNNNNCAGCGLAARALFASCRGVRFLSLIHI